MYCTPAVCVAGVLALNFNTLAGEGCLILTRKWKVEKLGQN